MTSERDRRRLTEVPEEPGTVADIGAISATESAFDRLARGEPPAAGDDPALRLLAGLSRDVRAVPPPPAWRTGADAPKESPARPGRAIRLGRRTALTGVGTVAVSVLCAVGVAAATGVDPVAAVTHGRVRFVPPAVTASPSPGKPRSAEKGERPEPSGSPSSRKGATAGPANPHQHPPGKAKGWARGNGHGEGHGQGHGAGPGSDHGKHLGQTNGRPKNDAAAPETRDARTTTNTPAHTTGARAPDRSGDTGPDHSAGPAGTQDAPSGHTRPGHPHHDHDPGQGK